jgi:putative RNA 2'-phosphotransferase
MNPQQSTRRLEKFIVYVLGRRPDEFGLVPEANGWVKLKDLLKAINEEDGWRYVRRSHIDEIVLTQPAPEIEIKANRVRARCREHLPVPQPVDWPPKLLYTCIRRRAYFVVLEKGIAAAEGENVVLAAAPDLALRIGKRRDPHPVLLTVNVEQALSHGIALHRFGELLYLAGVIPPGCFTGPPLPKEKPVAAKPAVAPERASRHEAGTFVLDPSRFDPASRKGDPARKHREKDWKKERRQQRKRKDKW